MTVQIVEIAGQKIAMLPIDDYDRLIDAVEDGADAIAAETAQRRREAGEEYLPAELVDRILAGESALKVWRKHRGLTQTQLAQLAQCGNVQVSLIEKGERTGTIKTWQAFAAALGTTIEDICPAG